MGFLTEKLQTKNVSISSKSIIEYGNCYSTQLNLSAATSRTNLTQQPNSTFRRLNLNLYTENLRRSVDLGTITPFNAANKIARCKGSYFRVTEIVPDRLYGFYRGITIIILSKRTGEETGQLMIDAINGPVYKFHNRPYAEIIHRKWGQQYVLNPDDCELIVNLELYGQTELLSLTGGGLEDVETADLHELILTGRFRGQPLGQFIRERVAHFGTSGNLVIPDNAVILPVNLKQLPFHNSRQNPNGPTPALMRELIDIVRNDPSRLDNLTQRRVMKIFAPVMPNQNRDWNYILNPATDPWLERQVERYKQDYRTINGQDFEQYFGPLC